MSLKDQYIPVIVGPTASGKTELGIQIAEHYNCEIISADSRQFFRDMNIGTAKQSKDELRRAKHHFVDFLSPTDESYSSYNFGVDARVVMESINSDNRGSIVVGGSGLYIQSLVHGFFDDLGITDEEKLHFRVEVEKRDYDDCYNELLTIDREYALSLPKNNTQRVHRALEVYHLSGRRMSDLHKEHREQRYFKPIYIGIDLLREDLYNRINNRFDLMLENGLLDEINTLVDRYGIELKRLNKTIGYREFIPYLKGEISLDEAIHNGKRNSRHFSKRQITWFKRLEGIHWVENNFEVVKTILSKKIKQL